MGKSRASWQSAPAAFSRARETPEPLFVQEGDTVAFLAQPFDLHQLQPGVTACRLQRIGTSANNDRRPHRRHAVDDRSGPACRADRFAAPSAEDAGESKMDALQAAENSGTERIGRIAQRVDHLVGALVAFPTFSDAAVPD